MKKSKRFTRKGVIEGFRLYENPKTWEEVWIIQGQLYKIDRYGDVIPIKMK